jgi:lipoate-protein ligase A
MQTAFKKKAVAINNLLEIPASIDDAKAAFKKGFEDGLNINLVPYSLTEEQWAEVESIADNRYRNDEWTFRR